MIRKTSETRALAGNIVNDYNDSQTSAYSTEYINDMNTYSTDETFTGKYWIDGKKIYTKTITVSRTSGTFYSITFDSNSNIDTIVDITGICRNGSLGWGFYRVNDDDQYRYYIGNYSKGNISISVGNNFPSPTHTAHITMLYTKITD